MLPGTFYIIHDYYTTVFYFKSIFFAELSNMEACMELVKAVSAREVELCREKVGRGRRVG